MIQDWPIDGLERVQSCPVCGSPRRRQLYSGLTDKAFRCSSGRWDLYQCGECQSAYLDPRPTPATIGLAYAKYFTHAESLSADTEHLSGLHRIRRALANGYRNHRFGTELQPASRLGIVAAMLLPGQRKLIDAERRGVPSARPGMRLLDVGCGNGEFLALARSAGWAVVGVEPDRKAVAVARSRGIDVREGGLETLDPATESFYGITLNHVIEHVHEPLEVLRRCHALLKPGGWIWLETPNIEAQGHERYGSAWRGLEPPRHLVIFTWASLILALEEAGFQAIEKQPYRPLCANVFAASEAIAKDESPSTASHLSKQARRAAKAMERKARNDPKLREFVTIKAWKMA
ncbi:class I SAM-dependent methyltransferase [Azoarcus sp. DN11]|uniref:class I SAM-dependent methyltransferase n=1 Tax=Azoarcus sp. DN11 TaxID=356837 RepID=UPI0013E38C2F|nr:class I SAM-dependent methyltransferase [Azoarcus sp. DN11]